MPPLPAEPAAPVVTSAKPAAEAKPTVEAKPAPEVKPAVTPSEAKPFRATVLLTKVSAPPDPKKTPYKEAFTVSEGKVMQLLSKTDEVAVGDTILLVEWVMKDRKVLPHMAARKAGLSGPATLTRWEKKLNASDKDTRMIVDDTENYDARMYWVGGGPK